MYYQKENFSGTYDFRSRFHNGYVIASHIHEHSEILYCKSGTGEVFVNGKKISLSDNEFVFIPPNYIHCYDCPEADVICAVFSNDFIPLYFKTANGGDLIADKINAGELSVVFEALPKTDKDDALLISAYLNLICHKVIMNGEFKKGSVNDSVLYQKVISYISENFTDNISLEKIAKTFGYNTKYLSFALHSLTGIHFTDFIALYRVEYAKELMAKNKELSVAEIAMKCGFSSINTFNRRFKKMTSMTPSEYRKKLR